MWLPMYNDCNHTRKAAEGRASSSLLWVGAENSIEASRRTTLFILQRSIIKLKTKAAYSWDYLVASPSKTQEEAPLPIQPLFNPILVFCHPGHQAGTRHVQLSTSPEITITLDISIVLLTDSVLHVNREVVSEFHSTHSCKPWLLIMTHQAIPSLPLYQLSPI